MVLTLIRMYKLPAYTIGKLYIDGQYFADTLEDTDRNLNFQMSLSKIKSIKVQDETAIPTGTYKIEMNTVSPKFGAMQFYKEVCDGKLPRLQNVPGFEGILIHCGNSASDTSGCVILGLNKVKGMVIQSQDTFRRFYSKLIEVYNKNEDIWITII